MRRLIGIAPISAVLLLIAVAGGADEPEKEDVDKLAARRFELMQMRMAAVKVDSKFEQFPETFVPRPIFRYSDPARSYVSAAVWKLGEKGRPRALMTTELHRNYHGRPRIVYEFLSLTPTPFTAMSTDVRWAPEGTAVEFMPVPNAEAPDASPERRLLQLRAIANRFACNELVGGERCELRLLPRPIDRYTPSSAERADGAIFLLTFGTNPEAVLFLESDGAQWTFAAGRLAGASKIALTIDGKTAWEGTRVKYASNSSYTATNAAADIPGVAPDGTDIEE